MTRPGPGLETASAAAADDARTGPGMTNSFRLIRVPTVAFVFLHTPLQLDMLASDGKLSIWL